MKLKLANHLLCQKSLGHCKATHHRSERVVIDTLPKFIIIEKIICLWLFQILVTQYNWLVQFSLHPTIQCVMVKRKSDECHVICSKIRKRSQFSLLRLDYRSRRQIRYKILLKEDSDQNNCEKSRVFAKTKGPSWILLAHDHWELPGQLAEFKQLGPMPKCKNWRQ